MFRGLQNYWFLFALLAVLAGGFWIPEILRPLAEPAWLPAVLVACVLFLTALPHDFVALRRTLRQPGPSALAIAVNSILLPLAAWPVSFWLPEPFRLGLLVTAAVPSTLASAAVWTRRAGGNDLIPVVVTAVTNLTCFLVTPFWIWLFIGRPTVDLDPLAMMMRLLVLVLLPIVAAQLARQSRIVVDGTAKWHRIVGMASQIGILMMVGIGIVQTGSRLTPGSEYGLGPAEWLLMGGLVLALHLFAWWFGWRAAKALGAARPDQIAVGFAGSQKTLMVGLHLAVAMGGGLVVMPIVTYHVLQLVADTVIADYLRRAPNDAL